LTIHRYLIAVKSRNVYLALLFISLFCHTSMAQSLRAGWSAFPTRPTENKTDELSWHRFAVGVTYPVFRDINLSSKTAHLVSAQVNVAYNFMRYTFLPRDLHNLTAAGGLTYLRLNPKHTWLFNTSPFWSAPVSSFAYSRAGLLGMGLYQRRVNTAWTYHVGALYILARQQFFIPLAGFHYRLSTSDQLQVNLPLNVAYIHQTDASTKHRISTGFNGFFSQTPFTTAEGYLRLRQLLIQYTYTKQTPSNLSWFVSGGLTGGRQIVVANTPVGDYESRVRAGVCFEAGLTVPLRKQHQPTEVPELDLFHLDELSLDELEEELLNEE
jgi:hypothetical protein